MSKVEIKVETAKTDEAVKIIVDESTKAETYIVNETTAKTFKYVIAIDKKFAYAIDKFSNAIPFDERIKQGKDWNTCLEAIKSVNPKAKGHAVFNIACAIDPTILKLKDKIGDENYKKMSDERGKNAKLVTVLEQNTDANSETVNWKNAFNLTQEEATKLSTGRLLNINRAITKKAKLASEEPEEQKTQVIASDLINDMFILAKKHNITEHAICEEMEKYMVKYQSELHAKTMSDLVAKNKQMQEEQNLVNQRLAVANAKKLNQQSKKQTFEDNEKMNAKLEAQAKAKKNNNGYNALRDSRAGVALLAMTGSA